MSRFLRRLGKALLAGALVVGVVGVAGLAATGRIGDVTAAVAGAAPVPTPGSEEQRSTATVERRTLSLSEELDGTLGYRGDISVLGGLDGVLTRQPAEGEILRRGDVLYEVDGRREVVLMYGGRPAWRAMDPDMSNGADVKQLERNLEALGYTRDGDEIDPDWDSDTTAAVERWQRDVGMEDDGTIDLGEIVFLPGPIRVSDTPVVLGHRVGGGQAVLAGTSTTRVVTVALEAGQTDLLALDDELSVELPDGTRTPGTVSAIGRVAQEGEDTGIPGEKAAATIDVEVTLDDPGASAGYDLAPVTVHVTRETREDALAVPVQALVALLEGGYAVEVVEGGDTRLVPVELGLFEDAWVEVRGNVDEGATVVVPS